MLIDTTLIPATLKALPQFVGWRYEENPERPEKPKKVPYSPTWSTATELQHAKSNAPASWSDFDTALQFATTFNLSGIGLCHSETDGLTGIDMDHVIAPDGSYDSRALPLIQRLAQSTYIEISPSGTGIRAWGYGKPQRSGKCTGKDKWLEIYSHPSNRYLTLTGQPLPISQADIGPIQPILDEIHTTWMQDELTPVPSATTTPATLEDGVILEKARTASNKDKFIALWAGDLTSHGGDASSADLALCTILAFWTDRNAEQIDRLFRQSALCRPKWDERRGERTYGEMTVAKAIALSTDTYSETLPENIERELQSDLQKLAATGLNNTDARHAATCEFIKTNCLRLIALQKANFATYATIREQLQAWLNLGIKDFDRFLHQNISEHPIIIKRQQTLDDKRDEFLKGFVYQTYDNRFVEIETGRSYPNPVFTYLALRAIPEGWDDNSPQAYFASHGYQFVSHECYYPGEPRIVDRESSAGIIEPLINVYNPSPHHVEPRQNDEECTLFMNHLQYLCDEDQTFVDYLINWMAFLIQNPGRRTNSVPLIIGPKGNGKTFIADVLVDLLGKNNVSMISNDDLSGAFQDGLGFKQLLVLEEFKVFEGQHTMLERFKPWVTNDRVGMNRKGLRKLTVDNIANTIAFSNHEDAIRIDKEERRYGVAISRESPQAQAYYKRLFGTFILKHGGSPASLLYLLLHRDLSEFNPHAPAPWTQARDEMISNTWTTEECLLGDMLELGSHGLSAELVTFQQIQDAFNTARIMGRGTSVGVGSRTAILKAAKAIGLQRLHNPIRLIPGSAKQTVVYSTRNHARWRDAGDKEVRDQFQSQAQPTGDPAKRPPISEPALPVHIH